MQINSSPQSHLPRPQRVKYSKVEKRTQAHLFAVVWFLVMVGLIASLLFLEDQRRRQLDNALISLGEQLSNNLAYYNLSAINESLEGHPYIDSYEAAIVMDAYGSQVGSWGMKVDKSDYNIEMRLTSRDSNYTGVLLLKRKSNFQVGRQHGWVISAWMLLGICLSVGTRNVIFLTLGKFRDLVEDTLPSMISEPEFALKNKENFTSKFQELDDDVLATLIFGYLQDTSIVTRKHKKLCEVTEHTTNSVEIFLGQAGISAALTDKTGHISWAYVCDSMSLKEVNEIFSVSNTRGPFTPHMFGEAFEVFQPEYMRTSSNGQLCFVRTPSGSELKIERIFGDFGQFIIVVSPFDHSHLHENWLDHALKNAGIGLTFFDRNGLKHHSIGIETKHIIPSLRENDRYRLSDLLAVFPTLKDLREEPEQFFDLNTSDANVYRIFVRSSKSGWTSIFHQDITENSIREKQLLESQRLKELGEIASGIAHDFNNALGVVIGQIEIAKTASSLNKSKAAMQTALKAAHHASGIVAQLMAYSRNQVLDAKIVDIKALIEANALVYSSVLNSAHNLKFDLQSHTFCYVDPEFLSSAIMNLVINARDAMGERGEIVISTQITTFKQNGKAAVELSVADTGSGIPENIQNKIFDPFFTTKSLNDGNGLGLSMVKGFVEQTHGKISFDTSPKGTTMRLLFPLVEVSKFEGIENPIKATEPKNIKASESENIHICMVDDDVALLETQAILVESRGIRVTKFSDPIKALETLKSDASEFDLLVLDMQMPNMHGLELAQELRACGGEIDIIICSGNLSPSVIEKAQKLNIFNHIEKPVKIAKFVEMIRDCARNVKVTKGTLTM